MKAPIFLSLLWFLAASAWAGESPTAAPVAEAGDSLSMVRVLDAVSACGEKTICLEQGPMPRGDIPRDLRPIVPGGFPPFFHGKLPTGDRAALQKSLPALLPTGGYDCEWRGDTLVIYDRKARESGDDYVLNRRIAPLSLQGTNLSECIERIGKDLGVILMGDAAPPLSGERMTQRFDVELEGMTLRDALLVLMPKAGFTMYIADPANVGSDPRFFVWFQ